MTTLWNRLDKNWRDVIAVEFETPVAFEHHMSKLEQFLQQERVRHTVYPNDADIFNALNLTAFEDVKVVIIGQDPYHGPGQAHGFCFSVPNDIEKLPPSLKNIYRELDAEYPTKMPLHGDLTGWAKQGVLLLNATLTVREAEPRSHEGQGWEDFTDAIIRAVSGKPEHVVFLLWGRSAQKKRALIDGNKHKVLEASHPSPRSAYRSFLRRDAIGCGHFREANEYLRKHKLKPIDWQKI